MLDKLLKKSAFNRTLHTKQVQFRVLQPPVEDTIKYAFSDRKEQGDRIGVAASCQVHERNMG